MICETLSQISHSDASLDVNIQGGFAFARCAILCFREYQINELGYRGCLIFTCVFINIQVSCVVPLTVIPALMYDEKVLLLRHGVAIQLSPHLRQGSMVYEGSVRALTRNLASKIFMLATSSLTAQVEQFSITEVNIDTEPNRSSQNEN